MSTFATPSDKHSLSKSQKQRLRELFQPKYEQALSDKDLWEIHFNLTRFMLAVSQGISESKLNISSGNSSETSVDKCGNESHHESPSS